MQAVPDLIGAHNSEITMWQNCPGCHYWHPAGQPCDNHHTPSQRRRIAAEAVGPVVQGVEYTPAQLAAMAAVKAEIADDDRSATMLRLERNAAQILCTEQPLYFCWRYELPGDLTAADGALAITALDMDLVLKDHLDFVTARGRGVVFNGPAIMAEFGTGRSLSHGLNEVMCHELSHIVAGGFPTEPKDTEVSSRPPEADRGFLEILMRSSIPLADATLDTYEQHGPEFWRATSHIICRAHAIGVEFDVCAQHERYGLSDASLYDAILRDEIEAFDGQPLIEALRSTEPPAAFVDLFNTDVARVRAGY